MLRAVDRMISALLVLLGAVLLLLMMLGLWNIVSRYLFDKAILWADEISVFGIIAMTWLGAVVCAWRGAEIRMSILIDLLPARVRRWIDMLQEAVIGGLSLWLAWLSWGYVSRLFTFGMKSDAARIPVWTVHVTVTIGLVGIGLIAFLRLIRLLNGLPASAWAGRLARAEGPAAGQGE